MFGQPATEPAAEEAFVDFGDALWRFRFEVLFHIRLDRRRLFGRQWVPRFVLSIGQWILQHFYDLGKKNRVTSQRPYLGQISTDFKKLHEVYLGQISIDFKKLYEV